ncbi:MAG: glycoside hydrolase family 3 protein [Deltaproteobacteria bacterium]|nr:glycoside hydrolase family 3 protein [Deltaproteobacteria bacterium]
MIMVGFQEAELSEGCPLVRALKSFSLGGVILYNIDLKCYLEELKRKPDLSRHEAARICPKNIHSPDQLKRLTNSLKSYSKDPLFIAVDQEGGLVSRLGPAAGFPETESPKALGEKDDLAATSQAAGGIAKNLKLSGINLNLAPVADLSLNPEGLIARNGRSFGSDPDVVYRHARAFILAHRQQGILTTLKHFPGKGSAAKDTHFEMADVTTSYQDQELIPFSRLIEEKLADMVMTSHIHHRGWDPEFPVTLSPNILRGLLREKLGYEGVVISDDLLMGAIVQQFSLEEASLLAIEAGVDILLASNNSPEGYDPNLFDRMFEAIYRAVERGRLSKTMIEASHGRIRALKSRLQNI